MTNYFKTTGKKSKQAPLASPSRLQGNQKKAKQVNLSVSLPDTILPPAAKKDNGTDNAAAAVMQEEWKETESKATRSNVKQQKKATEQVKSLLTESDSESEAEDSESLIIIPDRKPHFLLDSQSVSFRFSFTLEIDTSLDPIKFLKESVSKVNQAIKRITTEGQLSGYHGKAVLLPWEDLAVHSNRAWTRVKRSIEHTKLLPFFRQFVYGYGSPKGRKQDTQTTRKYVRINVAWIHPEPFSQDTKDSLFRYLSHKRIFEPDSFSLSPAPTMAINPTIAVQFRNSVVSNNSNWNDKGHEDCLQELNTMIQSFVSPKATVGLKKVTFSTGQNYMRGDPSMLSLECEKTEEPIITREILQAFRTVNRKSQIRDKCSIQWQAIPYYKGSDIQSNQKYQSQYVELKAKEAIYQSGIMMKYIDNIHSLDTKATPHFYLSKEMLKQLEEDIWEHNETPIRALDYDKLWDEIQSELVAEQLKGKETPTQKEIDTTMKKIPFHKILDTMASKGYPTLAPYDVQSFPTPNPSTRTLREFLMTMRSRRIDDAEQAPFVFEPINKTDDERVLFTFSKTTMEEATMVLDCLPLVIQHEMHLDPSCFLSLNFLKMCQGNYYNPLSRTGVTAVAACLSDEVEIKANPKHRIPKAIHKATAKEIEYLFKRKENRMFTFQDDSDLASIAHSIASYKLPETKTSKSTEQITNLQLLLQTHHLQEGKEDTVSAISDTSAITFDSKTSKNKYEIKRRADLIVTKKVDESVYQLKIKQGINLLQSGTLTPTLAHTLELPYEDIIKRHQELLDNSNTAQDGFGSNKEVIMETVDNKKSSDSDSDQFLDTEDDPLVSHLPESDLSDEDSEATPLRGSPNKTMAPDGHNVGTTS
eukprot:CAMPEP_0176502872 /NCGR_PEP_ID=MMETSP0200_2-20121128/15016_1 /TAXON_ID=947934 /ORGANISM="Chaetoceros sp., Strain GSL56" /LENGTH=869 /DNA_ID=CAMNT_0017902035 /DNA_START=228 /DNA_END=2837 /DNA_ORIENTATION=+